MDAYDELKLKGLEEYSDYRYYKGEKQCPYETQSVEAKWWDFERSYHANYKQTGKWKNFAEFLDVWITERAAPESGVDLDKGNPWKEEYEANAPF